MQNFSEIYIFTVYFSLFIVLYCTRTRKEINFTPIDCQITTATSFDFKSVENSTEKSQKYFGANCCEVYSERLTKSIDLSMNVKDFWQKFTSKIPILNVAKKGSLLNCKFNFAITRKLSPNICSSRKPFRKKNCTEL